MSNAVDMTSCGCARDLSSILHIISCCLCLFSFNNVGQTALEEQLKDMLNTACQTYPERSTAQQVDTLPTSEPVGGVSSIQFAKSLYFFCFALFVKIALM